MQKKFFQDSVRFFVVWKPVDVVAIRLPDSVACGAAVVGYVVVIKLPDSHPILASHSFVRGYKTPIATGLRPGASSIPQAQGRTVIAFGAPFRRRLYQLPSNRKPLKPNQDTKPARALRALALHSRHPLYPLPQYHTHCIHLLIHCNQYNLHITSTSTFTTTPLCPIY
jgi:hypothetical protein